MSIDPAQRGQRWTWEPTNIAAASLGGALIVFFAGATAAVAAGVSPPTALWAAGGAVSGGLLGLLSPAPTAKDVRDAAVDAKTSLLRAATVSGDAAGDGSLPPPTAQTAPVVEATAKATPWTAVWLLALVFGLLLTLAVFLAGGAITPPTGFGNGSIQNLTKTVVAMASAAGTGVIGLLAPAPTSSKQG